jgi:hypothetical protein
MSPAEHDELRRRAQAALAGIRATLQQMERALAARGL